jgi:hypothetical protein
VNEERIALRQQRDLGELIEAAGTLYFRNFGALLVIASVIIPLGIAGAIFQVSIEDEVAATAVVAAINLVQIVVNLLVAAAVIAALLEIDAGRSADFSKAYDVAFARIGTLIGASLRVAFHVLLLAITIVGIPWAIQRLIRWLFVEQAIIVDGSDWGQALSTSADAVVGRWWRTLGLWLVLSIVAFVPAALISTFFLLTPPVIYGTVTAVVNALVLPFFVTGLTMLYFDLKERKASAHPNAATEGVLT